MNIFEFEDYRSFIKTSTKSLPEGGKGQLLKIAKLLGINPSFLSQVFGGTKNLSPEQGWLIAKHFQMSRLETKYFELLISLERASKFEFKKHIKEELLLIKTEALSRQGMTPFGQPLDERNQAIFYSSWYYSGVQLTCGLPGGQSPKEISKRLNLDHKTVAEVLKFLVETGLCKTDGEKFQVGLKRTLLKEDSPLRTRHQTNWRFKAVEKMATNQGNQIFYTSPMRIDKKSYDLLKEMIGKYIQQVSVLIDEAGDEKLACLNIDLFEW